jgi:hypothetical protein
MLRSLQMLARSHPVQLSKSTPTRILYSMDLNTLIQYMKLHLISLEQDLEENPASIHVVDIEGQIYATQHLLSVAEGRI